jgi:DNA modification methylase
MEINAIYEGDNLEILSKFSNKSVDLIYADPPFYTNKGFEIIWKDEAEKRAFEDRWAGGIEHYITWMEPRLRECQRVLKDTGSVYLHCDPHANAHLRILMDKIFGEKNFKSEIIWSIETASGFKTQANKWIRGHDTILFYTKSKKYIFNKQLLPYDERTIRRYDKIDSKGRHYKIYNERGQQRIVYLDESKGRPMTDVWTDIIGFQTVQKKGEYLGYPTQKPLSLLERIINASSKENDIVLDPFCGCGTTLVAAQKLNRKWIGIDISPTACKLMQKRLRKQFSINAQLVRGEVDLNYIKKLHPFEFQNWVVVDKFLGKVSDKKIGDMGIDGFTPQVSGGYPIQVKQSEGIGRNVIDNFETAMRRISKAKGYIVAYSFGKGAIEEVARAKNQEGLDITLRTVQELLEGKTD